MLWYWLLAVPAVLLALASLRGGRARSRYVSRRLHARDGELPPATVIVPVKGEDEGLRENLAALASLDYPDYELIVAARMAADIPRGVLPARVRVVLSHAPETDTAEKVQNLLAAVRAARKRSQVLAFADSDGRPAKRWLRALVAPLGEAGVGASTGYRWFMPQGGGFWPLLRAVWDAVAAGVLGPGDNRFAWGGAMAIRKETFFEARVPEFWEGAISDDYALSRAVRAMKLSVAYAPGALTPCVETIGMARFFGWTRRQMAITRAYSPALWWPGLIAHIVYCAAMAASLVVALRGYLPAAAALVLQLAPGMWKGWRRAQVARHALPEYNRWFRRWGWAHALLVPAATWAWLWALGSSAFVRRIEWRG
ncbi:MAG: glycosyltransferase family 2 protein, partial [Acidobacteria bacterium]|nr:glycosyltransferase family 2 protein [Acidobacteriota bacterium]